VVAGNQLGAGDEQCKIFKSYLRRGLNLKALILAAGRGSRLGTLTANQPKCLVNFHEKPLLERAIKSLNSVEISDIALVAGYQGHQLKEYGLKSFENTRWESSGIYQSCLCADEWLSSGTTLIIYSDIFFSSGDLKKIFASESDIEIAYDPDGVKLWIERFPDPLVDLENFKISQDKFVTEIGGSVKDLNDVHGQYIGITKLTPKGWNILKYSAEKFQMHEQINLDMTSLFQKVIENGFSISTVRFDGPWGEIDSQSDLSVFESKYPSHVLENNLSRSQGFLADGNN
jgi:choline kinase